MKVRKEIAVLGCALIGAGFGYSDQANTQSNARERITTIEGCLNSNPYNKVVTSVLRLCITQGIAGGMPIDAKLVQVGEPRAELEAYESSQRELANSTNTGEIIEGAAFGGIFGILVL